MSGMWALIACDMGTNNVGYGGFQAAAGGAVAEARGGEESASGTRWLLPLIPRREIKGNARGRGTK
eukprot:1943433-Rhodomonas_salina.2